MDVTIHPFNPCYFHFQKSFQDLLRKQVGDRAMWEYPFAVAGVNITFMLIQMLDLEAGFSSVFLTFFLCLFFPLENFIVIIFLHVKRLLLANHMNDFQWNILLLLAISLWCLLHKQLFCPRRKIKSVYYASLSFLVHFFLFFPMVGILELGSSLDLEKRGPIYLLCFMWS